LRADSAKSTEALAHSGRHPAAVPTSKEETAGTAS
jgi:hypothetical protein